MITIIIITPVLISIYLHGFIILWSERPYFVTAETTGTSRRWYCKSGPARLRGGYYVIKISEETYTKMSHCYYTVVVFVVIYTSSRRRPPPGPQRQNFPPPIPGPGHHRDRPIAYLASGAGGIYVRAARNETDGQECARRTVAVARDKCAPPEPRARTTRIIIYNIILLWKK